MILATLPAQLTALSSVEEARARLTPLSLVQLKCVAIYCDTITTGTKAQLIARIIQVTTQARLNSEAIRR